MAAGVAAGLVLSASPAHAQESGGSDGGGGGDSSSATSSSDGSSTSSDGGSGGGYGSSSDSGGGYGSSSATSGYGSSDSGYGSSSVSSGYGSSSSVSSGYGTSDSGYGSSSTFTSTSSTDSGYGTTSDSGNSSSNSSGGGGYGSSDSSYGSTGASMSASSTDGGSGGSSTSATSDGGYGGGGYGSSDSGYGGSGASVSTSGDGTDSGYGSSDPTSDTGYGAPGGVSRSIGGDVGAASGDLGMTTVGVDTGSTGFEGSPEVGPAHAVAVDTGSPTYTGETSSGSGVSETATAPTATGFGATGPSTADAAAPTGNVGAFGDGAVSSPTADGYATTYGDEAGLSGTTTGFEGSPEVGPVHAEAVNDASPSYTGDIGLSADPASVAMATTGPEGDESNPEIGPLHAQLYGTAAALDPSAPTEVVADQAAAFAPRQVDPATGLPVTTPTQVDPATGLPLTDPGQVGPVAVVVPAEGLNEDEINPEVGPALARAILQNEVQGEFDAARVRQALDALGIPTVRFTPDTLRSLDPADPRSAELYQALADAGRRMGPDDRLAAYAQGFLDLGLARAITGVADQFTRLGEPEGQSLDPTDTMSPRELANRLAYGFGNLTRSPGYGYDATQRDPNLPTAALFEGVLQPTRGWEQTQLAQLIGSLNPHFDSRQRATQYDADFLTRAAQTILVDQRELNEQGYIGDVRYPPLTYAQRQSPDRLAELDHREPEVLAMRALAANPEAAWNYTGRYSRLGTPPQTFLAQALRPDPIPRSDAPYMFQMGYLPQDVQTLREQAARYGADIVRNTFIDAVAADPGRYAEAVDRYADAVRIAARGTFADPTLTDPSRTALAQVLGTYVPGPDGRPQGYLESIGREAARQHETGYLNDAERMAEPFNRVDLVNAWTEIGRSIDAARALGQAMTAWTALRAGDFFDNPGVEEGQVRSALRPPALVLDTVRQGFDAIGVPDASRKALAENAKYWGNMWAAGAGPVANLVGGLGRAGLAAFAGATGSASWAGSTAYSDQVTATPPPPVHGDDFSRIVAETLRQDAARALAAAQGRPTPAPGEVAATLDQAFPRVGDPFETLLDMAATERTLNSRTGTHWSSRPGTAPARGRSTP